MSYRRILVLLVLVLATGAARAAEPRHACGEVAGTVRETGGGPLDQCLVTLGELGRRCATDVDGDFAFAHVPAGRHLLRVTHLGYRDLLVEIHVEVGDTLRLSLDLQPRALALGELRVRNARERLERLHEAELSLSQTVLQGELGATLAETLDERTGIATRSMGPAPARPVMRGHSGERLLLLEDGAATGDLSATSSDHAVAIEPVTARRVEWIRGAETLLHASGAAGGVLNVEHDLVPLDTRRGVTATAALLGDSGTRGLGGTGRVEAGSGDLAWMVEGSQRHAGDARTPAGRLANSSLGTGTLSAGLGLAGDRLRAGAGGTIYSSDYGIPGGFVGGHPNGVDITLRRRSALLRGDWRPASTWLDHVDGRLALGHYHHDEYESSGLLGIDFDVLSAEWRQEIGLADRGDLREGSLVLEAAWRDFATGGLSHAPDTDELRWSLAAMQHLLLGGAGGWHWRAALRADLKRIVPDRERTSLVVGHIRARRFTGISAALQADPPEWRAGEWAVQATASLQRAWRPPTVEELFSGGPHLAAYSYEIGNPELEAETGWLGEAGVRAGRGGLDLRVAAYNQRFQGYIFPSFTGRLSPRRADLYEYRTVGRDAWLGGLEAELGWTAGDWRLEGGASAVRGGLSGGGPLPAVPPPAGRLRLERRLRDLRLGAQAVGALAQDRVYQAVDPGARPEARTAGWLRLDADLQWRRPLRGAVAQVDLRVENALDLEYRNHLSRIRSVMPEAGLTVKAVGRVWI